MKKVIYVHGYNLEDLTKEVNAYALQGYVPYGAPVPYEFGKSGTCGHERGFAQSMIFVKDVAECFESVSSVLFGNK